MELHKRFLPYCDNEYANKEDNAYNCEDVANNFALAFAQWVIKNEWSMVDEELLSAFKIEYKKVKEL